MGEKSAENLLTAIEESKSIPLSKFLFALGIPEVGEHTADLLAAAFPSLKDLIAAKEEDLLALPEVGPRTAEGIVDFFSNPSNKEMIAELLAAGVDLRGQVAPTSAALAGKRFVLTGTLSTMTRGEAGAQIKKRGGTVSSSVSARTDYVVVGENPGSKAQKARELNITTLTEDEFLSLLGEG
jgi:DNA ligase (NAD+)